MIRLKRLDNINFGKYKGYKTLSNTQWCERGELNPHGVPHWILSPARLPVPPLSPITRRETSSFPSDGRFASCLPSARSPQKQAKPDFLGFTLYLNLTNSNTSVNAIYPKNAIGRR